jgi:tetratricopeptide (TPR) repeat protein
MSTAASPRDHQNDTNYSQPQVDKIAPEFSKVLSPTSCQAPLLVDQPNLLGAALSNTGIDQERQVRQLAKLAAQQGDYEHAIVLMDALIEDHPSNAAYYSNRGLLHFQAGHPEAAIRDYDIALKLNPKLASAYNNRGNYYAAQGCRAAAISDYDRAIDLDPGNIRARINQSITLRELGDYERAIEELDLALQLVQTVYHHTDSNTNGLLEGHLYTERGRTYHLWGDWNYAIADYQRALELLPEPGIQTFSHRLSYQVEGWLLCLLNPENY